MALLFVDEQDYDDQPIRNSLYEAQRVAQRLTDRANGSAAVTQQMAQNLASAGHRSIRPDLQYQPPAPHPPPS